MKQKTTFYKVSFDSPARLGDDHFGAELVELLPQLFGLEVALNIQKLVTVALRLDTHLLLLLLGLRGGHRGRV